MFLFVFILAVVDVVLCIEQSPLIHPGLVNSSKAETHSASHLHLEVATGTPGVWYSSNLVTSHPRLFSSGSGQFVASMPPSSSGYIDTSSNYGLNFPTGNRVEKVPSVAYNEDGSAKVWVRLIGTSYKVEITRNGQVSVSPFVSFSVFMDSTGNYIFACTNEYPAVVAVSVNGGPFTVGTMPCDDTTVVSGNGAYIYTGAGQAVAGFYRSSNFGATFKYIAVSFANSVIVLKTSFTGRYVYSTATKNSKHVVVSSDFGVSWRQSTTSTSNTNDVSCDSTGRFAVLVSGTANTKAMVSSDFGVTWTAVGAVWYSFGEFVTMSSSGKHIMASARASSTTGQYTVISMINPLFTEAPTAAPTTTITAKPTAPTAAPTSATPTKSPTAGPTRAPSFAPSAAPTADPSFTPSQDPTAAPSYGPTAAPSFQPSVTPSADPSASPSADPTFAPSFAPSPQPSVEPTESPSIDPTLHPTNAPSEHPSVDPSVNPSVHPTAAPTTDPSAGPTMQPTADPSVDPTPQPSFDPTSDPTLAPTTDPTFDPTVVPTAQPSVDPTADPSVSPSTDPSADPTFAPTVSPTVDPTAAPTAQPSVAPTLDPSAAPTVDPTVDPSANPTVAPTMTPSVAPTADPTAEPTVQPSADPTVDPSAAPTVDPSANPSVSPTMSPSAQPTVAPTVDPTADPTAAPTVDPSAHPSAAPTADPTASPSAAPTRVCLQWVLGQSGQSCSATCSAQSRVCKDTYFESIFTSNEFDVMVSSAVTEQTSALVGDAQTLCSGGIDTVSTVGGPVALSLVLRTDHGAPVRTMCSYPTSAAAATLGCDATLSDVPFQRFCPCVNYDCDAPPSVWYLGNSGDSCRATCDNVEAVCETGSLKNVITTSSFAQVLSTAVDASTGLPLAAYTEEFCNGGVNVFDFASAPAVTTAHVRGGSNVTFCNFPESAEALHGDCDVSFPGFGSRRFCSCRPAEHPTRKRTLTELSAVDASQSAKAAGGEAAPQQKRRQLRGLRG